MLPFYLCFCDAASSLSLIVLIHLLYVLLRCAYFWTTWLRRRRGGARHAALRASLRNVAEEAHRARLLWDSYFFDSFGGSLATVNFALTAPLLCFLIVVTLSAWWIGVSERAPSWDGRRTIGVTWTFLCRRGRWRSVIGRLQYWRRWGQWTGLTIRRLILRILQLYVKSSNLLFQLRE